MELTCFLDYCLACDKQTAGETYCSQACRLADLETSSTWSGKTSPSTASPSPSWTSSDTNRGSGFYLSPAINFAAYKSPITSTSQPTSPLSSYFPSHTSSQVAATKTLSPSSSRSSLSSTSSISSRTDPLSEQARTELRGYTDAFDSTRNSRRRMTWS